MSKILLADDDPFLTKIYSTKLVGDGHEVITCSDGQSALDKASEENPDLIILDIMLPRLSGLDVLSQLKEDSKLKKIPVIILSNLSQDVEKEDAQKRGAKDFLAKADYTPSQVVAALEPYLKTK